MPERYHPAFAHDACSYDWLINSVLGLAHDYGNCFVAEHAQRSRDSGCRYLFNSVNQNLPNFRLPRNLDNPAGNHERREEN
jgi:hypothetical protein